MLEVRLEQRKIGKSDLSVSVTGLGCNNFSGRIDLETTRSVVHRALDLGITLFDTADVYGGQGGSEEYLGEILGKNRKDIILATKFAMPMDKSGTLSGASRDYIIKAIEASLKRLKTDWIDLYQVHRPDDETPIEETMLALDKLIQQGKVRYIGCSNFSSNQVIEAHTVVQETNGKQFISCQDEYSLLVRDTGTELFPTMQDYGMGLLPYFPLASGLLTGKYQRNKSMPEDSRFFAWPHLAKRYMTDHNWNIIEGLNKLCIANNRTMIELAFSWLASNPVISSVIAGATSPDQVEENSKACTWRLTSSELDEINEIVNL